MGYDTRTINALVLCKFGAYAIIHYSSTVLKSLKNFIFLNVDYQLLDSYDRSLYDSEDLPDSE